MRYTEHGMGNSLMQIPRSRNRTKPELGSEVQGLVDNWDGL